MGGGEKTENSHGNRYSHVWSVGPIVNCHADSVHKINKQPISELERVRIFYFRNRSQWHYDYN